MKDNSKKAVQVEDKVVAQGRVWDKENLQKYRDYQNQFTKDTYRSFVFRLSKTKDAALIAFLERCDNCTDTLRQLVTALCEQNGWMEEYARIQEELKKLQAEKEPEKQLKDTFKAPQKLLEQEAQKKAKQEQDAKKDNQ